MIIIAGFIVQDFLPSAVVCFAKAEKLAAQSRNMSCGASSKHSIFGGRNCVLGENDRLAGRVHTEKEGETKSSKACVYNTSALARSSCKITRRRGSHHRELNKIKQMHIINGAAKAQVLRASSRKLLPLRLS